MFCTDERSQPSRRVRHVFRRVVSDGILVLAGRALGVLTALGVNAVLARLLAPDELGTYYLTLSVVSLGSLVAQMGLTQSVVRLVAESLGTDQPGRARGVVRTAFRLALLGALATALLLAVGVSSRLGRALLRSSVDKPWVGLTGLWVIALCFSGLIAETLRGFSNILLATLFGGLSTSVLSLAAFGCCWVARGMMSVSQALGISLAATALTGMSAGLVVYRRARVLPGGVRVPMAQVLSIALPQLVTSIVYYVLNNWGIWLLALYRSQGDVAIYGAVTKLVTLVITPLLLVNAVVMPLIAEMYAQGRKEELEAVLRATATASALPALLLLGALLVGREQVLGSLFGDYYRAGSTALVVLGLAQAVNALSGSCGLTLMMTGNERPLMLVSVASGAMTVLLGLAIVRQSGPTGVAVVSALGLALQNIATVLIAKHKTGMWTHAALPVPAFLRAARGLL